MNRRRPEGLELCRPELVREALAVAARLDVADSRPIDLLRVVDAGASIVVVNGPDARAPGRSRR